MMTFEILARQNPWWTEPGSIEEDPYIRAFDEAPLRWVPPFFHALNLREDLVYIVLGPRQVGKTTFGDVMFYWRNGGEIDFVVFREGRREILIEVRYQGRIAPENAKALVKWGGGILFTRNLLSFDAQRNLLALPLPYLLALL